MIEDYDYLFKCVICGDNRSGKTALTNQFAREIFRGDNRMIIGVEFTIKTFEINGHRIKVQIFDIEDRPRFQYVMPLYFKGAMGAVVVFDLTNQASFDHVPNWVEKVRNNAGSVPMLLVGNKSDLVHDQIVFREEAEQLAKDLAMIYVETSTRIDPPVEVFPILAFLMIGDEIPLYLLASHHRERLLAPFGMETRRRFRNQSHFL
jgi:small GTP-binding protein